MSHWESAGKSDDWWTPRYIFDALGVQFDLDVAAPEKGQCHVPAKESFFTDALDIGWFGFVWMNPPFGKRGALEPWLEKFFAHDNGIALTPDRTSAPWFQKWAPKADRLLFLPKVRFQRPDGSEGKSPSNGTVLMAVNTLGVRALGNARRLGIMMEPSK